MPELVARFAACTTSPDSPSFAAASNWEREVQASSYNRSIFGQTANLYVGDRCFVPRRVCTLRVRPTALHPRVASLLLPRAAQLPPPPVLTLE